MGKSCVSSCFLLNMRSDGPEWAQNEPLCIEINRKRIIVHCVQCRKCAFACIIVCMHSITMKASTHYRAENLNFLTNDDKDSVCLCCALSSQLKGVVRVWARCDKSISSASIPDMSVLCWFYGIRLVANGTKNDWNSDLTNLIPVNHKKCVTCAALIVRIETNTYIQSSDKPNTFCPVLIDLCFRIFHLRLLMCRWSQFETLWNNKIFLIQIVNQIAWSKVIKNETCWMNLSVLLVQPALDAIASLKLLYSCNSNSTSVLPIREIDNGGHILSFIIDCILFTSSSA